MLRLGLEQTLVFENALILGNGSTVNTALVTNVFLPYNLS